MDVFMSMLIKMSLRGVVIILVALFVRLLLKKLQIGHKYILGLWAMVFLYFIFPWKLSLSVGFWSNDSILEEMREISEYRPVAGERYEETYDTEDIVNPAGNAGNVMGAAPGIMEKEPVKNVAVLPMEPGGQNIAGMNKIKDNAPVRFGVWSMIGFIWLVGFSGLFGHMLYSYFALKRKLRLSVLVDDNIWWAENIDMPMVFGLICPQIYLPVSMESEELSYVIAHEKMHVRRKDGLFKIFAYVVCLIHWFNPFIWMAYFLFGSDMEKACDEEVIRSMSRERRKEYAYALLHIAAENGARKKSVFIAPICFDEGNVKSRIRNIMRYKYTFPGIGIIIVIVIVALSVIFLTERKGSNVEEKVKAEEPGEDSVDEIGKEDPDMVNSEEAEALPVFYVEDLDTVQIGDSFSLEDYYITSRYTASNHYYIDENKVLWGTGKNEFGQLGTGTYDMEESYEEPVKIAENVISVDASWNDYFCIYLTEGGELYGVGLNHSEVLLGEGSESQVYSHYDFQKVTEPVLLMTDVAYARAGRECIVALQNNKTAYWWGQYAPLTHTYVSDSYEEYWKLEEDASNPVKMFAAEPKKIMEQCKYVTTGTFTGAAISESGELYTWGLNVFGQCGVPVTEDDFVRTPTKVMDNVKMAWTERIVFSDPISRSSEFVRWETDYIYNTFILTEDNDLLAVGLDIGDKEKVTQVNGDLVETQTNRYSDVFVPMQVVEYSVDNNMAILRKLEFGMAIEEVREILSSAGMRTFEVDERTLVAQNSQYYCYFDSQNGLDRIMIQEGGSRDGRFMLGMSFSDLEEAVGEAGGSLTKVESDIPYDGWLYQDKEQQIQYEFALNEGSVSSLDEMVISENISGDKVEEKLDGERILEEQSFQVGLNDWGEVRFVSYEPAPSENGLQEDVTFYLLKDEEILYQFPYIGEDHTSVHGSYWDVKFVMFTDTNADGKEDVVIGAEYMTGSGPQGAIPHVVVRIYEDCSGYFTYNEGLSDQINDYLPWESNVLAKDIDRLLQLANGNEPLTNYESYTGEWTVDPGFVAAYENPMPESENKLTCSISNGNEFYGAFYVEQEATGQIASVEDIVGTIQNGELFYEFTDDGWGGMRTLHIMFLPNQINVEVQSGQMVEENVVGYGGSGIYEMTIRE